jgi:ferredoxin
MIVYDGAGSDALRLHSYLLSAGSQDARLTPSFSTDPDLGTGWQQQFSLAGNEQPELIWPETNVVVTTEDGAQETVQASFTAAAFMLCESAYQEHFAVVAEDEWHDDFVPIEEYGGETQPIPFLLAAVPDGTIERVMTTDFVWQQMRRVGERWRLLRELGGFANSFAEKAVNDERSRLEAEHQTRLEQLEEEHRSTLEKTTGELARQIVANIAAGLLDGTAAGVTAATSAPPVSAPPPKTEEREPPTEEPEEPAEAEPPEEEDLDLFDEPYIETPRCTSCDECTTLNPRLFAYNENKQAYIADLSAGTYRDLVLAAEKCPVRIIHPGKPLNPDEPHLEELLKRAEPFL